MAKWSRYSQPVTCIFGRHLEPPPRDPAGPIVSICPCCGRAFYSHGATLDPPKNPSNLIIANFPAVVSRPAIAAKRDDTTLLPE